MPELSSILVSQLTIRSINRSRKLPIMSMALRAVFILAFVMRLHCQEEADVLTQADIKAGLESGEFEFEDIEGAEGADQEEGAAEEPLSAEQMHGLHGKFDANGDGKVTLQEIMVFSESVGRSIKGSYIGTILEEIDTSRDGYLSLEEHLKDIHNQAGGGDEAGLREREEETGMSLDQQKDLERAKFKAADLNGDGKLEENELLALFQAFSLP